MCMHVRMHSLTHYWLAAQGLSALFTYSVLLATPWRLSILVQCFGRRCKDSRDGGVGFYGKPHTRCPSSNYQLP